MVHVYNCHPFSSQQIVQVGGARLIQSMSVFFFVFFNSCCNCASVVVPVLTWFTFHVSGGAGARAGLLWRWSTVCGGDWRMQGHI